MNLSRLVVFLLFLMGHSYLYAFTIYFPLEDMTKINTVLERLEKGEQVYEIFNNYSKNRVEVVFNDHYLNEIKKSFSKLYPKDVKKLNIKNSQIFVFSEKIKIDRKDYFEALLRSNIFPNYHEMATYLKSDFVYQEMEKIDRDPDGGYIKVSCDARNEDNIDEFLSIAFEVSRSLFKKIKEIKKPDTPFDLFIVGGSMETYYHFLKIFGENRFNIDQIYFLKLSRRLFRDFPEETVGYIKSKLSPLIKQGHQMAFFDTVYRGESMLTFRKMLNQISLEEDDSRWKKVIMLGGPELEWEQLTHCNGYGISPVSSLEEYYRNINSFIEVNVPTPQNGKNGTRYVFAENQHFIRGKYHKIVAGEPQSEYLYPRRLGRDRPVRKRSVNIYRLRKMSSILLMLTMLEIKDQFAN